MKKRIMPLELFFSSIIIISIIFVITIICLEIKAYSIRINSKTEMALIASNIIENIKTRSYDDVEKYLDELSYVGITKKIENNIQYVTVYGNEFNEKFFGTTIPGNYIIDFEAENNKEGFNIQKKINVSIYYINSNKTDGFEISTIIERENINECNTPIISNEYFKEFGFLEEEHEFIPIKYSKDKSCFITTTKDDTEWFNYSAKQWAKILVFRKDDSLKDYFVNSNGTINELVNYNDTLIYVKDYVYVWIPNFSIKDDITYFRYKAGKKAIKNELSYSGGVYLYLNKIGEEIKDISEDCNFEGIEGVWKKLGAEEDPYYSNFNKTKYAPQRLEK